MPQRHNIPIEDHHEDIIGKSIRGKKLKLSTLATESGTTIERIDALLEGEVDEETIRAIAPQLELDANSLVIAANKIWRPQEIELSDGLAMFNTEWHDMRVNAYVIWDPETKDAAIFDSGADAKEMIQFIEDRQLVVHSIYLTHTHGDHIADLSKLQKNFPGATTYVHGSEKKAVRNAEEIDHGHIGGIGSLALLALHTHGHSKGGLTYLITGMERPIAVVGDSLFAGSMGGGQVSYQDAVTNNREKILTLPDDTILCPGHGPMSSVAEEKAYNPFFPELK